MKEKESKISTNITANFAAKEWRKDQLRGREEIALMQKGTKNKIKAGNVQSFDKFLREIDQDRRNHRHYTRALERFGKFDQTYNAFRIIVNSSKKDLIEEAKSWFKEPIKNISHKVNETTLDIHAAYALCVLIENSIDSQLKREKNNKLNSDESLIYEKYGGMTYLKELLESIYPEANTIYFNALNELIFVDVAVTIDIKCNHCHFDICRRDRIFRQ